MLNLKLNPRSHIPADCAVFFRSRERHGQLSNMTHAFPLTVNAVTFQGPEGLYQALKFPHDPDLPTPDRRPALRNGGEAHRLHPQGHGPNLGLLPRRRHGLHPGPQAPPAPGRVRRRPDRHRSLTIVERSSRDPWWGASPDHDGTLTGHNVLGQILSQLRNHLTELQDPKRAAGILLANADTSLLTVANKPAVPRKSST